jgi:triacylglycerol lipase
MRAPALASVVALALVAGLVIPARFASATTHPSGCGAGVRRVSSATRGAPVLFVHGFAGGPSDFRRRINGNVSMLEAVRDLPGVAAYTFDYSRHSLDWVTAPAIGEALGRAIVCLADHHGRPVTVVAHSMGGLATRQAQGQVVGGRPVAASLDRVITVGTPFQGTQLLGFADGPGGDVLREVVSTALRACDTDVTHRPGRSFCDLLGASETAAVQGMIPGSAQLAALPPWSPHVRIAPIAADIEIGIDAPFGFSEQFAVGDFAVSVASATADSSAGTPRFVATCHAPLFGLVEALDGSPCSHANELANRRIIHRVSRLVRATAARESATT